jgi:hypothetical protein
MMWFATYVSAATVELRSVPAGFTSAGGTLTHQKTLARLVLIVSRIHLPPSPSVAGLVRYLLCQGTQLARAGAATVVLCCVCRLPNDLLAPHVAAVLTREEVV